MKYVTLIDVSNYYGYYFTLHKLGNTNFLKIFLDNLFTSALAGKKVYLTVVGEDAIRKVKDTVSAYKDTPQIIVSPAFADGLSLNEKVFFTVREALQKIINDYPEIEYLHFYSAFNLIFDADVTRYLMNEVIKNGYEFAVFNLNNIEQKFAPFIISTNILRELLNIELVNTPKYYYPTHYFIYDLKNKYHTNIEISYQFDLLGITYDFAKRCYLFYLIDPVLFEHLDNVMSATSQDPHSISLQTYERMVSFPDRFAIEIGFDGNGNNIFYPKVNNARKEWISIDDIKSLLNSLNRFPGILHFDLIGSKDPLLHPEIKTILRLLNDFRKERQNQPIFKSFPVEITIYTHGLGLTDDIAGIILETSIDNLLFNTFTGAQENYTLLTGLPSLEIAKSNFLNFLYKKYCKMEKENTFFKPKPETGITMILSRDTEGSVQSFLNEWDKLKNYFLPGKEYSRPETEKIFETFYRELKLPLEHAVVYVYNPFCGKLVDKTVADFTPLKRFPCRRLINGCVLLTNGKITLCEQDMEGEYCFANATFDLVKDFVLNDKYQIWIKNHRNNIFDNPDICKTCDQYYIPVY
ncbi:MAG: SPASM domain-containing protein [Candidatus Hydrogenedentota bacterium]